MYNDGNPIIFSVDIGFFSACAKRFIQPLRLVHGFVFLLLNLLKFNAAD